MSNMRTTGRRTYRPAIGDALERRELMSTLTPSILAEQRRALIAERLMLGSRGVVRGFTTNGGQAITLMDTDGEIYRVSVLNAGTVRAQPLPGGRVGLIVQGTGPTSEIEIDNVGRIPPVEDAAHAFASQARFRDRRLNVGLIDVINGQINGIFGFGTTELSGPLIVRGGGTVDRIALADLTGHASITVGGTLNQLEILNNADLSGAGAGIFTGLDLNVLNVGGNLTLRDGATVSVGRDLGLLAQAPQGTGLGGRGARINGNLALDDASTLVINRNLAGPILVLGSIVNASRIGILGERFAPIEAVGDITA